MLLGSVVVVEPWTQWDHIAAGDDDDALGDGDRPLSGTLPSVPRAPDDDGWPVTVDRRTDPTIVR